MSDEECSLSCEELKTWFNQISKQSWYDLVKTNHDELSVSYIDILAEFASLLQINLRKSCNSHTSLSESILFMKGLKEKLPSMIEPLFSSVNLDEISAIEYKDDEEVASNLFTRVLEIFRRDNRTVNDLYNDLDINKDGKIKFEELRAEFLKCDPSITIEESRAVFDILDGNKDGFISLHELTKRTKLIEDKAEQERSDPLACMILSKPLDSNKIHGNLAVMLIRGENIKPGAHSIKIRLPGILEYMTPDHTDPNPHFNYRADFFLENRTEDDLPLLVELELINKSKIEGVGSFQWKKAMNSPNEFSLKVKVPVKTSTGQVRGSFSLQLMWTPITVRRYTEEELQKRRALEIEVLKHRKAQSDSTLIEEEEEAFELTDEEILAAEDDELINQALEFSQKNNEKPRDNVLSRLEEIKKIEQELEEIENEKETKAEPDASDVGIKKANRNTVQFTKSAEKEEILPAGRKSTKISIHRRDSSYSYIMKVGKVTVEEVIKKNIKQPRVLNQSIKVTTTHHKPIELGKKHDDSASRIPKSNAKT